MRVGGALGRQPEAEAETRPLSGLHSEGRAMRRWEHRGDFCAAVLCALVPQAVEAIQRSI